MPSNVHDNPLSCQCKKPNYGLGNTGKPGICLKISKQDQKESRVVQNLVLNLSTHDDVLLISILSASSIVIVSQNKQSISR